MHADIQDGIKSWSSLAPTINADSYVFAKDSQAQFSKPDKSSDKSDDKPKIDRDAKVPLTCKDYNAKSNTGENCSWELEDANAGKRCNRLHVCSKCVKSGAQRTHRAIDCSNSGSRNAPFQPQGP